MNLEWPSECVSDTDRRLFLFIPLCLSFFLSQRSVEWTEFEEKCYVSTPFTITQATLDLHEIAGLTVPSCVLAIGTTQTDLMCHFFSIPFYLASFTSLCLMTEIEKHLTNVLLISWLRTGERVISCVSWRPTNTCDVEMHSVRRRERRGRGKFHHLLSSQPRPTPCATPTVRSAGDIDKKHDGKRHKAWTLSLTPCPLLPILLLCPSRPTPAPLSPGCQESWPMIEGASVPASSVAPHRPDSYTHVPNCPAWDLAGLSRAIIQRNIRQEWVRAASISEDDPHPSSPRPGCVWNREIYSHNGSWNWNISFTPRGNHKVREKAWSQLKKMGKRRRGRDGSE